MMGTMETTEMMGTMETTENDGHETDDTGDS